MWYWTSREARAGSSRTTECEVGCGFCGGDGVECQAGFRRERLARAGKSWRTGRKNLEERFGQGEGFRRESFEDGVEGFFLFGGRDDLRVGLVVAAEVVAIVKAADLFDGGFGLVAMEEIEGNEGVFELRHRSALFDGVFAEASEAGGPDGQDAVEFVSRIGAVVPEVGVGVGSAEGTGVFVGDVDEAGLLRCFRGWHRVRRGLPWVYRPCRIHDSRS